MESDVVMMLVVVEGLCLDNFESSCRMWHSAKFSLTRDEVALCR